uniref:Uncharacterized protein n=1 Tax=Timema poppense TaxID=170557 RepID=A0A7R9CXX3_TIMPO|nr:unnamed protein product [Timema poppensis]
MRVQKWLRLSFFATGTHLKCSQFNQPYPVRLPFVSQSLYSSGAVCMSNTDMFDTNLFINEDCVSRQLRLIRQRDISLAANCALHSVLSLQNAGLSRCYPSLCCRGIRQSYESDMMLACSVCVSTTG